MRNIKSVKSDSSDQTYGVLNNFSLVKSDHMSSLKLKDSIVQGNSKSIIKNVKSEYIEESNKDRKRAKQPI